MNKTYIIDYIKGDNIEETRIHASSLTKAINIFYIRYNNKIVAIYEEM